MKYEITEGLWIAFFNTLTGTQKSTRDITAASGKNSDAVTNRNTIAWSSGDATTTNEDRACSYLSWMDGAAFADWAALRPFTELEFEKIQRGPGGFNAEYAGAMPQLHLSPRFQERKTVRKSAGLPPRMPVTAAVSRGPSGQEFSRHLRRRVQRQARGITAIWNSAGISGKEQ
jgi:hypothetical protein